MNKFNRSIQILSLAMILAITISTLGLTSVSAQPTQALIEDWRNSDYVFTSNMLDTDANDNVYILGDSVATRILVIKKFTCTTGNRENSCQYFFKYL